MDNNKQMKNNDLEKIRKVDIDEIRRVTHIDASIISDILDEKFENLLDTNVIGLIRIIERDFKVDLSELSHKFSEYKNQNKTQKNEIRTKISPTLSKNNGSNLKLWLFVAIALACAIIYFQIYKFFKVFEENNVTTYSNEEIVTNVENTLTNIGINIPNIDENITNRDINTTLDENSSLNALDLSISKTNTQNTDNNASTEQNIEIQTATIELKGKVWIGTIDLQTHKKQETTATNGYDIDLNKDQLIVTGHGEFKLKVGDEISQINDKNKQRFLVKDRKIEKIDENEFKRLNNGKLW